MELKKLFTPLRINGMEMRNRISMPAMHLHYSSAGMMTDKLVEFYAARARGGVGLITLGGCAIDKVGGGPILVGLNDDKFVPGLTRFNDAMHEHGAKTCAQLYQAGKYIYSWIVGETPVSASAVRSNLTGETPKPLDKEGIKEVIEAFASGAERAKRTGFDSVEVLASAGYLISQFLSPVTNLRDDEYGGSLENRARFGCEAIRAVRERVGKEYPVIVRVAGADFVKGGHTNRESRYVCGLFKEAGADAFNVTGGWHETKVPQLTMGVPRGAYVYLAARIRKAVGLPVIASNRVPDPILAEKFLRDGLVDAINMARPLIADPELPNKAREGRFDEIRKCIACNQGCFDAVFQGKAVSCMVNPMAGRESTLKIEPAAEPKRVMVIGGGPAGMQAAISAAERGHRVTLYERSDKLGGQLMYAAAPPDRQEFMELAGYLKVAVYKAGVTVKMNTEVTPELIEMENPDAILLATGARQIVPSIPGLDGPNVFMAWDVLTGRADLGDRVVIIGGGAVGVETAISVAHIGTADAETVRFLIENGAEDWETVQELVLKGTKEVTLIEMLDKIGKDIGKTTRWTVLQDLDRHGVEKLTRARAVSIDERGVTIERSGRQELVEADSVVVALGAGSENALAEEIRKLGRKAILIGDAKKPRKAFEAIHEGFEAGIRV